MCFDKTGTLTENFMSLKKIVTLENDDKENINLCLANCHCLILQDNVVNGDGMELALFDYSKAQMNYSHVTVNDKQYVNIKIFDFVNELERMSVVVQNDNNLTLLAKGSPEKMKKIF